MEVSQLPCVGDWGRVSRQKCGVLACKQGCGGGGSRGAWGELGGGGEVQFWVVAPEPLLSRHQKEGELPPDFSRLKWQGMAAPGAPAARAGVQG